MRGLLIAAGALALLLCTGCATVTKGSDQAISVTASGCDDGTPVSCEMLNKDRTYYVDAPGTIEVDKSSAALAVSCRSEGGSQGNLTVESSYEAMNAGNILLGGIIGVGVDAISGAMWKYPKEIDVPLVCASAARAGSEAADVPGDMPAESNTAAPASVEEDVAGAEG